MTENMTIFCYIGIDNESSETHYVIRERGISFGDVLNILWNKSFKIWAIRAEDCVLLVKGKVLFVVYSYFCIIY